MAGTPVTWTVIAKNLGEHASNPIHTDEGAAAAGFPSALVAGVTVYAYLTHPIVAAWGVDWLTRGSAEVRFHAPVFAERAIDCTPSPDDDAVTVAAIDPAEATNPRAVVRARREGGPPPARRDGERLATRHYVLEGRYGADYGARAGDDLAIYLHDGIVHPAVWPAIANNVFSNCLVNGAWIHTRSIIRHHAVVPAGAEVDVETTVVERYERRGRRAVADIVIAHDGRPVATLEHEAIVDLSGA